MNYAFANCYSLASINIPNASKIGSCAFSSCTGLVWASFPKCSSFYSSAFYGCAKLESLYLFCYSIPNLAINAFYATPLSSSKYLGHFGSIYVRESLYSSYITATNWRYYSSRIVSMTDEEIAALDAAQ